VVSDCYRPVYIKDFLSLAGMFFSTIHHGHKSLCSCVIYNNVSKLPFIFVVILLKITISHLIIIVCACYKANTAHNMLVISKNGFDVL